MPALNELDTFAHRLRRWVRLSLGVWGGLSVVLLGFFGCTILAGLYIVGNILVDLTGDFQLRSIVITSFQGALVPLVLLGWILVGFVGGLLGLLGAPLSLRVAVSAMRWDASVRERGVVGASERLIGKICDLGWALASSILLLNVSILGVVSLGVLIVLYF
ncbi:MAG: hypothetical protein EA397_07065 [Deltaproteobacteria bacterium]|nr:MAG: hypothetical protein EA397_07065 [Deltaproteobacteria bacterium]